MEGNFKTLVEGWFSKKTPTVVKLTSPFSAKKTLDFNFDARKSTADDEFYKQHLPKVETPEQKHALDTYTKEAKGINRYLRNNMPVDDNQSQVIQHLTSVIKSSKSAQDNHHLYSGVNIDPQTISNKNIHMPSYTSASTDHRVAGLFAKKVTTEDILDTIGKKHPTLIHHVLKINVKKGQHIGSYIAPHSSRQFEREFLINKNHTFYITGKYEDHIQPPGIFSKSKIYRVHEVTIEPHE